MGRCDVKLHNIGEGSCPVCGARMEVHEHDHGRCPNGHGCYSATTGDVTLIVHLTVPQRRTLADDVDAGLHDQPHP